MSRRNLQNSIVGGAIAVVGGGLISALVIWGGSDEPTLIIGALVAQTSPHDQATRQGLELAIEALDAELSDERLALEVLDPTGGNAEAHLQALEARRVQHVIISDVHVLVGCARTLEASNLVVLTTDGDARLWGGPRLFCVARHEAAGAHELALWSNDLGVRRPAAVLPAGPAGDELSVAFGRGVGGINDERLLRMGDAAEAGSLAARLGELVPSADAVVFLVPAADALRVVQAMNVAGNAPLLLSADPTFPTTLATTPARTLLPRVRLLEVTDAPASSVRERVSAAWKARFGGAGAPPAGVFAAWDAVHAVVQASRAAKGDPEQTLELLRATQLEGATGLVSFTHEGVRVPPSSRRWRFGADGGQVPWSFGTEEATR